MLDPRLGHETYQEKLDRWKEGWRQEQDDDLSVVGRTSWGGCGECNRLRHPRGPDMRNGICPKGHDKNVVGLAAGSCRICFNESQRLSRLRRKDRIKVALRAKRKELLAVTDEIKLRAGCKDCGYKDRACALQFDHLRDKVCNVSLLVGRQAPLTQILAEVAKCEVVCANCHAIRTQDRRTK